MRITMLVERLSHIENLFTGETVGEVDMVATEGDHRMTVIVPASEIEAYASTPGVDVVIEPRAAEKR